MAQKIGSPFPGLRVFSADESELFFGREGQSDELARKLERERFVAVVGTSGSGKSSLVRAGLLSSLEEGVLVKIGSHWRLVDMQPGSHPIANLAASLQKAHLTPSAAEAEALGSNSLALSDLFRGAYKDGRLAADENLLVLVDQFEELFRYESGSENPDERDEKAIFVKLLLEAARLQDLPVYVVITMRSDFLGDCARFRDLPEAINTGQYLIPRMTREQRRKAIEGPVHMGSGEIAPRLVQRILNDVGEDPDQLPVMQHALMRTWYHWRLRAIPTPEMDIEDYEDIGTLKNALSQHADEAYQEVCNKLPGSGGVMVKRIFQRLRDRDFSQREVRRPTPLRELIAVTEASEDEVRTALECFRREGRSFLMPPMNVDLKMETAIDITHESLLRQWERLKGPPTEDSGWLAEEEDSRKTLLRLVDRAADQQAYGETQNLRGLALDGALEWWRRQGPTDAWARRYTPSLATVKDLLDASADNRERERRDREERDLAEKAALAESIRKKEELAHKEQIDAAERRSIEAELTAKQQKTRWLSGVIIGCICALVLTAGIAVIAFWEYKQARKSSVQAETNSIKAQAEAAKARDSEARAVRAGADLTNTIATLESKEEQLAFETKRAEGLADEANLAKKSAIASLVSAGAQLRLSDKPDLALLLAVQANENKDTADTRSGLLAALQSVPHLQTQIRDHTGQPAGLAFQGNTLLSLGLDNEGTLLKHTADGKASGRPLTTRSRGTLSANGEYIIPMFTSNPFWLYRVDTGTNLRNLPKLQGPYAISGDGKVLAGFVDNRQSISSDGKVPAEYADNRPSIQLWDLDKGAAIDTSLPLNVPVYSGRIALSENGSHLAVMTSNDEVTLFEMQGAGKPPVKTSLKISGACTSSFDSYALAFDKGTRHLAAGCPYAPSISLWDLASKTPARPIVQNAGTTSLAFSADGRFLAAGSPTGSVTLFSLANGFSQRWSEKADSAAVSNLSFSADSKTLASSGAAIALWSVDQQNLARVGPVPDPVNFYWPSPMNLAFGKGQLVTLGITPNPGTSAPTLPAAQMTPGAPTAQLSLRLSTQTRSLSGLGLQDKKDFAPITNLNQILLSPNGQVVAELIAPDKLTPATAIANNNVSRCGLKLQLLGPSGTVLPDKPMAGEGTRGVMSIAFSPDGRELLMATCQDTGKDSSLGSFAIKRWDLINHTSLGNVPLAGEPTAMALSSDRRMLAAAIGSNPAKIQIWNLVSNKRQELQVNGDRFGALLFSPDLPRKLIASDRNGTLTVSSADDGKILAHFRGLNVFSMSLSQDGKTLATGMRDGSIALYDADRLRLIGTLPRSSSGAYGPPTVAFNPVDSRILAADAGGTITVWPIDPSAWRKLACNLANRNLTYDEWKQYGQSDDPYQPTCGELPVKPSASLLESAKDSLQLGDSQTALAILKTVQQLDPKGLFNPQRELDQLQNARRAQQLVQHADEKEREDPLTAWSDLKKAMALDKFVSIPSDTWAEICVAGSLRGAVATVMPACMSAVKLDPDSVDTLASRGVAECFANDFPAALKDFQAALGASDADSLNAEWTTRIQGWITVLKTNHNPMTPDVIKQLLKE